MSIPPFPSQDLAKLVLGYLAEEQLMTVYDEFLVASPYLDASKNEYNRVLMRSLQSIVAEYWAAKIYVEKCKPYPLRRVLLQNSNLLEVIKFLVYNVDMSKIEHNTSFNEKNSFRSNNQVVIEKCMDCENSYDSCFCKSKCSNDNIQVPTTEATPLTDLPGNNQVLPKRKHVKVLEKDSPEAARLAGYPEGGSLQIQCPTLTLCRTPYPPQIQNSNQFSNEPPTLLDLSVGSNDITNGPINNLVTRRMSTSQQISHEVPLQENSSQFDNSVNNFYKIAPKINQQNSYIHGKNLSEPPTNTNTTPSNANKIPSNAKKTPGNTGKTPISMTQKTDENKITIISDVKVDNNSQANTIKKRTQVYMDEHSNVVKTIVINGTPVYNPKSHCKKFTRDEILSMPTIILVSAPGPPPTAKANTHTTSAPNLKSNVTTTPAIVKPIVTTTLDTEDSVIENSASSALSLPPLTIDVSNNTLPPPLAEFIPKPGSKKNEGNLIKTVDVKNKSVPKDPITKVSTPQALPLVRKSSSTPRRNSHVRVLDFTTPRRILQETISENATEVVISRSPNLSSLSSDQTSVSKTDIETKKDDPVVDPKVAKRSNWDAGLRALALASCGPEGPYANVSKRKPKRKPAVKKEGEKKASSPKSKTVKKKKLKSTEVKENDIEPEKDVQGPDKPITVKPTINIITDWKPEYKESEKKENKSSDNQDTPDMEKNSLPIPVNSAKLNISDLLETPYKQALYDIQMETPKFLRPDLPASDEPVSEIKITDIPTPRFFENNGFGFTTNATPSSYSSRPTDYSSGGSYYKPDEQEYVPHMEDIGFPVIESNKPEKSTDKSNDKSKNKNSDKQNDEKNFKQNDTKNDKQNNKNNDKNEENIKANREKDVKKNNDNKSSRPVRQCRKNVTYYDSKNKPSGKFLDSTVSSYNPDSSHDSLPEDSPETPISNDRKRRSSVRSCKKSKTPEKKSQKSFMKIKPKKVTPSTDKRKSTSAAHSQKRTISKDRTSHKSGQSSVFSKSRRKSSTPRKLRKISSSESDDNIDRTKKSDKHKVQVIQDSDTENLPLRWSDDGSQDTKIKESQMNDVEDILKIKAYIEQSAESLTRNSESVTLDLVKRGFDLETARSIERDLLDSPPRRPHPQNQIVKILSENVNEKVTVTEVEIKSLDRAESVVSTNHLKIVVEEEEVDEVEFSICECNDEQSNYIGFEYMSDNETATNDTHKLKENFTMEFCFEEETIRLNTTNCISLIDIEPDMEDFREVEAAVSSISNFDRLYTPIKNSVSVQDQCREIFDSTLASLDTPLKIESHIHETTSAVSEVILEVEQLDEKEEIREKARSKRKRTISGSGSDESSENKRKRETRMLPNIHNIDIESVLSRLHGP